LSTHSHLAIPRLSLLNFSLLDLDQFKKLSKILLEKIKQTKSLIKKLFISKECYEVV
jgi:hypothetical protein